MLSPRIVFKRSSDFTPHSQVRIPSPVPIDHHLSSRTNEIEPRSISLFHANVFKLGSLPETLYFPQGKRSEHRTTQLSAARASDEV